MDGEEFFVFGEFGGEGEVELADGKGEFAGVPPDGFAGDVAVADPEFDVTFVRANALERTGLMDVAEEKTNGWVPNAAMFDAFKFADLAEGEIGEIGFGVETQGRRELVGLQF